MKTLLVIILSVATASLRADDKAVVVHEWGTFTCLQDEQGHALGGINVDDEPVPSFVWGSETVRRHNLGDFCLPPYQDRIKGWRPADPDVTMRLETPVLYFYPPKGTPAADVPPLDVYVKFYGGVLSQYYPYAVTDGMPADFPRVPTPPSIGTLNTGLDWKGVQLGSTAIPVQSDDPVWTTPRDVSAPMLAVPSPVYAEGQMHLEPLAEHFLFYRGLGHVDSPVFLGRKNNVATLGIHDGAGDVKSGWVVEIRPDGKCAARFVENNFEGIPTAAEQCVGGLLSWLGPFSTAFVDSDFTYDNLTKLKSSMHDTLVKEGLYDDEATAMLKTWELSYFKSPGLRFFYIVPHAWVGKVLPLTITGAPTEITRVMVGRIELISDEQKAILARLSTGPCPDLQALKDAAENALKQRKLSDSERASYYGGEKPLSDLGIPIPPFVQDYLRLGRFRDAMVVHEQQEHPSPALAQFIKASQLSTGQ
jgi:hypothetical protein